MPGFFGSINSSKGINLPKREDLVLSTIEGDNYIFQRYTTKKFLDDKLFVENKDYIVTIDGTILNKDELYTKYDVHNMEELFEGLHKEHGELFFDLLKGTFAGFLFKKTRKRLILFSNKLGDKPLYYYHNQGKFLFSTDFWTLTDSIKAQGLSFSFDESAQYSLLTYGFQLEDKTLLNEVKKVQAGTYIFYEENSINSTRYHLFNNKPDFSLNEDQIIEKIDALFLQAVKRQLSKNEEYGYDNYAPLSAGLDSRMTVFGINRIFKKPIVNFSYSQNGYYDDSTPKMIASVLGNHYLFKSLDNGLSLFYLDETIEMTGGNVLNYGPGQVWDFFRILNKDNIGLIHTGMLGDVVVGTFYKSLEAKEKYELGEGAYSNRLLSTLAQKSDFNFQYPNQEIFNFYNRGFNGANMGSPVIFQQYTESHSPFYDIDFLEFCLTIPLEYRWDNKIYYKWISKKYPEAKNFLHNGVKIDSSIKIKYKNRKHSINSFIKLAFNKIKNDLGFDSIGKHHMNPLDFWYKQHNSLKLYMDTYLNNNISLLKDNQLRNDCQKHYEEGNGIEKNQVLTLLSFHKRITD